MMNNSNGTQKEEVELVNELNEKCNLSGKEYESTREEPCEAEDGRISGGSNESAFSSSAGFCSGSEDVSQSSLNELTNTHTSSSSCSGRSSVNKESQHVILNPHSNIAPTSAETRELVDKVRLGLLEALKNGQEDESYDELDIEELKKPLPNYDELEKSLAFRMISRYLNFHSLLSNERHSDNGADKKTEKEINTAIDNAKDLLKFRHQYQICRVRSDQFAKEFYIISGMFPFGYDKNHTPVLYVRAYVHRRWSLKLDDTFRRYVVWQINEVTKTYAGARVNKTVGNTGIEKDGSFGLCFDCINVSYACLDMDFLRFLVKVLVSYYPTYCRYALCVDLPWLFRSVWKLVRSWLPVEAQNTVQLITSKQLVEFIDEDQIPSCMRVHQDTPIKNKHILPKDYDTIGGIEDFAKDLNLGNSEVKQFKSHVEKIRKEYEQLGAL